MASLRLRGLSKAQASGTYAALSQVFGRPSLMSLGDSIVANGGGAYNPGTGQQDFFYQPKSWIMWGQLLSGSRFLDKGCAATTGYTIQQIKTTHLPTVLAARPTYCVVLAGQNNLATLSAQDFTDLTSIYTQLQAAGIVPIAATLPATQATAALLRFNSWVKRYARDNGVPLLDLHATTVDTTSGLYKATYSSDATHPDPPGAKAMGQQLANLMIALLPTNPLASLLADTNGLAYGLTNPLLLTDNGATPPYPTGWSPNTTGGSAFSTDASVTGRVWTLTRTGGADNIVSSSNIPVVVGNRMLFALKLGSAVKSVGGAFTLFFQDPSNGAASFTLNDFTEDIPLGSILAWEWTVPSGLNSANQRFQVRVKNANAATGSLGQVTSLDLTALGAV